MDGEDEKCDELEGIFFTVFFTHNIKSNQISLFSLFF
jgi:hypothetical protein